MKGLLFTPEMARAVCAGRKSVTRRVIVPQPPEWWKPTVGFYQPSLVDKRTGEIYPGPEVFGAYDEDFAVKSDYVPGERRCLLTTWSVHRNLNTLKPTEIDLPGMVWHAGIGEKPDWCGKSRPGRFLPNHLRPYMPLFDIVSVRAERLQDITTEEIIAEGVTYPVEKVSETQAKPLIRITGEYPPSNYLPTLPGSRQVDATKINHDALLRAHWCSLWDSINAERGFAWEKNPWIWRIQFRPVT